MQSKELPELFRVVVRDAALSPELNAGDELVFDRRLADAAAPGDLVLLRGTGGDHVARYLRERLPGQMKAHALNQAFDPLDLQADGLRVVAVCVEERRKRRQASGDAR